MILNCIMREICRCHQTWGAPSETKIGGRHVLRACITNHRTTRGDLETLVESAATMGRAMVEEMKKR